MPGSAKVSQPGVPCLFCPWGLLARQASAWPPLGPRHLDSKANPNLWDARLFEFEVISSEPERKLSSLAPLAALGELSKLSGPRAHGWHPLELDPNHGPPFGCCHGNTCFSHQGLPFSIGHTVPGSQAKHARLLFWPTVQPRQSADLGSSPALGLHVLLAPQPAEWSGGCPVGPVPVVMGGRVALRALTLPSGSQSAAQMVVTPGTPPRDCARAGSESRLRLRGHEGGAHLSSVLRGVWALARKWDTETVGDGDAKRLCRGRYYC